MRQFASEYTFEIEKIDNGYTVEYTRSGRADGVSVGLMSSKMVESGKHACTSEDDVVAFIASKI